VIEVLVGVENPNLKGGKVVGVSRMVSVERALVTSYIGPP